MQGPQDIADLFAASAGDELYDLSQLLGNGGLEEAEELNLLSGQTGPAGFTFIPQLKEEPVYVYQSTSPSAANGVEDIHAEPVSQLVDYTLCDKGVPMLIAQVKSSKGPPTLHRKPGPINFPIPQHNNTFLSLSSTLQTSAPVLVPVTNTLNYSPNIQLTSPPAIPALPSKHASNLASNAAATTSMHRAKAIQSHSTQFLGSSNLSDEDDENFEDDMYGDEAMFTASEAGEANAHTMTTKRRRRTRDSRQQELNRLAQRRYRERKKQRQQDLVSQVDQLAAQLEQLNAKDEQIKGLKKAQVELQKQYLTQQAMLQSAHNTISAQTRTIDEQRVMLEQQRQRLERVVSTQAAASQTTGAASPTAAASIAASLQSLDPSQLADHLARVLRDALGELDVRVDLPSHELHSKLTEHITRSINGVNCWRDIRVPKTVPDKPPAPITVSCC